jgi:hypothetical protein
VKERNKRCSMAASCKKRPDYVVGSSARPSRMAEPIIIGLLEDWSIQSGIPQKSCKETTSGPSWSSSSDPTPDRPHRKD